MNNHLVCYDCSSTSVLVEDIGLTCVEHEATCIDCDGNNIGEKVY